MVNLTIAIIGAGQMGAGIAQACATAGMQVILQDITEPATTRGVKQIDASLSRSVKKEIIGNDAKALILSRITTATDYRHAGLADILLEAATENIAIKEQILAEAEKRAKPSAIFATNTSSVSITALGAAMTYPDRLIGIHFFNPVVAMKLVEVIRGICTSDTTYERAVSFVNAINKTPINVRNSPGFVVNRLLIPMINEAIQALQDGVATAADIDTAMTLGANHPIGPLALADLIGLDTCLAIMSVMHRDFGDDKYRAAPLLKEMVDAGHLGRKTGMGFYPY